MPTLPITLSAADQEKLLDGFGRLGDRCRKLEDAVNEVAMRAIRAEKSAIPSGLTARRGEVSEGCARLFWAAGVLSAKSASRQAKDRAASIIAQELGIDARTALSETDIPLPVGYNSEIVELVSQYGAARQFGTVFPAPNGTFNLPRLKTDPGLSKVTQSSAIPEKNPQTEWVDFAPQKFAGLVRLPSEIDEDAA